MSATMVVFSDIGNHGMEHRDRVSHKQARCTAVGLSMLLILGSAAVGFGLAYGDLGEELGPEPVLEEDQENI